MINKRRTIDVLLGNGDIQHKVVIESIECLKDTPEHKYVQMEMLRLISVSPDLVVCGNLDFQTLNMKYVGNRWIVEVSAIEVLNRVN